MSIAQLGIVPEPSSERGYAGDRTPPHDVLAEQSTLGGMLLSKDAVADVIEVVRGRDFYLPKHEIIFDALLNLYSHGEPTDVITVSEELTKTGMLSDHSGALTAAFEFTTKRVKDVTIPLEQLVTLPEDATPRDVHHAVAQRGFSRYVLVNEDDDPSGYVHIKDVLDSDETESDYPVPPRRIRNLVALQETVELEDALATLRGTGSHVAKVLTSTGETAGVLFLEDIIEELVGEVRDATTSR